MPFFFSKHVGSSAYRKPQLRLSKISFLPVTRYQTAGLNTSRWLLNYAVLIVCMSLCRKKHSSTTRVVFLSHKNHLNIEIWRLTFFTASATTFGEANKRSFLDKLLLVYRWWHIYIIITFSIRYSFATYHRSTLEYNGLVNSGPAWMAEQKWKRMVSARYLSLEKSSHTGVKSIGPNWHFWCMERIFHYGVRVEFVHFL